MGGNEYDKELAIIRAHCEKLGLGDKCGCSMNDLVALRDSLKNAGELELANYIESLAHPDSLEDFLVNTVYQFG